MNIIAVIAAALLLIIPCSGSLAAGNIRAAEIAETAQKDYYSGEYFDALEGFITGLKVARDEKDSLSLMICTGYISNIYNCFNDYSSSLAYLLEGYEVARMCNNENMNARFLSNIVSTCCRLGDVKSAEKYYALEEKVAMNDRDENDYYLLYNKARIMQAGGRFNEALQMHHRLLDMAKRRGMAELYSLIQYSEIGNVLVRLGRYSEARKYGEMCMSLSGRLSDDDLKINAYNIMAGACKGLGQADQYALYHSKALALTDSVFNPKRFYMVCNRLDVYRDSVAGERITMLNGIVTRQSDAMFLLILLVVVMFAVSGAVWYAYRRQTRTKGALPEKTVASDCDMLPGDCMPVESVLLTVEAAAPVQLSETDSAVEEQCLMSREQAEALYEKIEQAFNDVAVISEPEFSLGTLSQLVGSNMKYVSWVINSFYGKNFKTILNECRVREACIRLGDTERYGNITIQGIYESLGYRSASSFNRAFRQVTGMSPSAFLKQALVENV